MTCCSNCDKQTPCICTINEWKFIKVEDWTTSWCCKDVTVYTEFTITDDQQSISDTTETATWRVINVPDTNTDELVWVMAWDTPKHLEDKIYSCSSCLKIDPVEVNPWDYKLRFCLDDTCFVNTDEKVAFKAWCATWYASDMWDIDDWEDCLYLKKSWCKWKIGLNKCCRKKPIAVLRLSHDIEVRYWPWWADVIENKWWFVVDTDDSLTNLAPWDTAWSTTRLEIVSFDNKLPDTDRNGVWHSTTRAIKINCDGRYSIELEWASSINYWINGIRHIVYSTMPWKMVLVDTKEWEPVWYSINSQATDDAITNPDMFKHLEFGGSKTHFLSAGTIVFWWGRMDNRVDFWPWVWADWCVLVKFAWLSWWVLWWGSSLSSDAWYSITVKRDTDANWWSMYPCAC